MFLCLCLCRSICRRLDCIPLFCFLFVLMLMPLVWTRLKVPKGGLPFSFFCRARVHFTWKLRRQEKKVASTTKNAEWKSALIVLILYRNTFSSHWTYLLSIVFIMISTERLYNVYMMFIYNVYIIVSVVNLRTSGISIIKCGLVNWMRRRAWCYINGYINRYLKVSRLYSIFISGLKCTSWC